MLIASGIQFRTIDLATDANLVAGNHHDACVESFGDDARYEGRARYLAWLEKQIEEFPDGHVLALSNGMCVGHLEAQVPYGLTFGYVNLFYVTPPFRGFGIGRHLQAYAERYVRSWEAGRVELHVSRSNEGAMGFYRVMGYRTVRLEGRRHPMWKMAKDL